MGDRKQHGVEFLSIALVPQNLDRSGEFFIAGLLSRLIRHNRREANDFEVSCGFRDV